MIVAISNAVYLCTGKDPQLVLYDQNQMRHYLHHSFKKGELDNFVKQNPELF